MCLSAVAAAQEFRPSGRDAIPLMSPARFSGGEFLENAVAAEHEEWRPVGGHLGYEVSNFGRVGSWRPLMTQVSPPSERRILKLAISRQGYYRCALSDGNGQMRSVMVAHLVLKAFHGPRPEGLVARHLDGDQKNNRSHNLTWSTQRENINDKLIHGTMVQGERHHKSKLTESKVSKILASNESSRSLAEQYGVDKSVIQAIRNGEIWKTVSRSGSERPLGLLTQGEVAVRIGLKRGTISAASKRGVLPIAEVFQGRPLYHPDAADTYGRSVKRPSIACPEFPPEPDAQVQASLFDAIPEASA